VDALLVASKETGIEANSEKTKYICMCHAGQNCSKP
jgi:hypothetical protein